jgi:hypothetical protein
MKQYILTLLHDAVRTLHDLRPLTLFDRTSRLVLTYFALNHRQFILGPAHYTLSLFFYLSCNRSYRTLALRLAEVTFAIY